jgi:hypothetical protein
VECFISPAEEDKLVLKLHTIKGEKLMAVSLQLCILDLSIIAFPCEFNHVDWFL